MDADIERERTVFVTVGTTSFDALVKAVDCIQCKAALARRGYTKLLIQLGRGTYFPVKSLGEDGGLKVDYFTFSPNIAGFLSSAALVISHAGSGSIFETLRVGRPLIVVVNEALMDNHQSELAEELAERKFLYCAHPETLAQTIECMDIESLLPYPPSNPMAVVQSLNWFLGFSDN
uniref:Glycosyl transferase family 28 C-terminal domain-containing protein n=1 Tax=Araucaria cunninghamii TaxID=56994 RepID=A0A0D6R8L8_ARACU